MKKTGLLLASVIAVMTIASCGNNNSESTLDSQTSTSTAVDIGDSNVLSSDKVVNLITNARLKDIELAISATQTLDATGFDNGRKYHQTQKTEANTYKNNLTVASGSLEQYFDDAPTVVYKDTFDQVRVVQDSIYTSMRVFKNKVFRDETERINIIAQADASTLQEKTKYYCASATCGAGLDAYEQFMYAYSLGADMFFGSGYTQEGASIVVHAEYASDEKQNQMVVYDFTYVFDDFNNGFLKRYKSEQIFYSLNEYKEAEDKTKLVPKYSTITETKINSGSLRDFQGELPIDLSASFIQTITLSAGKSTIEVDETIALKSVITPSSAINQDIGFASEDESIARVDTDGRVIGIAPGTTRIVATSIDSGTKGYFTITVTEKAKPESGDNSKKGDLKAALNAAITQKFQYTKWIGGNSVTSITGMGIDDTGSVNSTIIGNISLSDFSYDENQRKATYIGSKDKIVSILPYYDNGNANLPNNYTKKERSSTIYRDTFLGFEIYLKSDNTISYIVFSLRSDYIDPANTYDFAKLTEENIETTLGSKFVNGYARTLYYESAGFVNEEI